MDYEYVKISDFRAKIKDYLMRMRNGEVFMVDEIILGNVCDYLVPKNNSCTNSVQQTESVELKGESPCTNIVQEEEFPDLDEIADELTRVIIHPKNIWENIHTGYEEINICANCKRSDLENRVLWIDGEQYFTCQRCCSKTEWKQSQPFKPYIEQS